MDVGGVQGALVGFALFDAWLAGMKKLDRARCVPASPLVDAAFKAFDAYAATIETQNSALIAGTAAQLINGPALYARNAHGTGVTPITVQQMAPMLALNILG